MLVDSGGQGVALAKLTTAFLWHDDDDGGDGAAAAAASASERARES